MWVKSSRSNPTGNSVEVEFSDHQMLVRDSKDTRQAPLSYSLEEWDSGRGVVFREVADDAVPVDLLMMRTTDHWHLVEKDGKRLYFDQEEKMAWDEGVEAGDFELMPGDSKIAAA